MRNEVLVANQSLQQLRNLRQVVEDLTILGHGKNHLIKQLIDLENKKELQKVEMEQLKFVVSLKLQKLMLTLTHLSKFSVNTIGCTYDKIIEIEEEVDSRLHVNQKVLHLKIIQTLLDYRICEKYGLDINFSFEELLPIIQQHHQFEKIYSKKDQPEYKFFFLGLMVQSLQKKQIQNYLQIYGLTMNYLKQRIEKLKRETKSITHESIVQELIVLLNVHLSFKLLKKHLRFQQQNVDQNVYVLLYDLDYAINEKLTIDYKKLYSKTLEQALAFSISKIRAFIVDLNSEITFDGELLSTKKRQLPSDFRIRNRSSSSEFQRRLSVQKARSLNNKINTKKVEVKNKMFIPQQINFNKRLEHRIQLKSEKKKLQIGIGPSNKRASVQSITCIQPKQIVKQAENPFKMQFTTSKDQIDEHHKPSQPLPSERKEEEKLTYSSCLKNIVTTTQELQLMLCQRPSNLGKINFENKNSAEQATLDQRLISSRRKRSKNNTNSRRISQNYSGIKMVQERVEAALDSSKQNSSLFVPPLIKKNLNKYLGAFLNCIHYQAKRQRIPFFHQLVQLNPAKFYYLHTGIYQFISVSQENLKFKVAFLLDRKCKKQIEVDLKELSTLESVRSLFLRQESKLYIFELFYLGRQITLFKLNLSLPSVEQPFIKYGIDSIRYQYEVYAFNVYLNSRHLNKMIIKKILQKQEEHMRNISKDLEIHYDYNKQDFQEKIVEERMTNVNEMKFHQFFNENSRHDQIFILMDDWRKSLKINKLFIVFRIKLYRYLKKEKYYLILQNDFYCKYIVACKKLSIQQIFKDVRTLKELKQSIIDKNKLYYQCWNDVLLNRSMLELPSKKYCVRSGSSYRVYYTELLIEHELKLMFGCEKEQRWFVIVSLLEIEPMWLKAFPSRDRKIKSSKSMKFTSRRQIKAQETGLQLWLAEHIKSIRMTQNQLYFNRETYRLFNYQYHWIYYENHKLHICFKNQQKILDVVILRKQLMYINKINLKQPNSSREQIFDEFRKELRANYRTVKMVLFEFSQIVKIGCESNRFVCCFQYEGLDYRIEIDQSEFTLFKQANLVITEKMLHHKLFQKRMLNIIKEKIYELSYETY